MTPDIEAVLKLLLEGKVKQGFQIVVVVFVIVDSVLNSWCLWNKNVEHEGKPSVTLSLACQFIRCLFVLSNAIPVEFLWRYILVRSGRWPHRLWRTTPAAWPVANYLLSHYHRRRTCRIVLHRQRRWSWIKSEGFYRTLPPVWKLLRSRLGQTSCSIKPICTKKVV